MIKPMFFSTQTLFREWLITNHDKETELLVGLSAPFCISNAISSFEEFSH